MEKWYLPINGMGEPYLPGKSKGRFECFNTGSLENLQQSSGPACLELEVLRLIAGCRYWWWIQPFDVTPWQPFLRLTRNTAYQILIFILLIDVGPSYPKVVSVFSTVV